MADREQGHVVRHAARALDAADAVSKLGRVLNSKELVRVDTYVMAASADIRTNAQC